MSFLDITGPTSPPKILDFDIENRPLTYLGQDFTTSDVTAIAAGFTDDDYVWCGLLGEMDQRRILTLFRSFYDAADIVTGHYIRKHDLPIINGAMVENGLPMLGPKLTVDTKLDLKTFSGVSKSQESLAAMLGIEQPKIHMTQGDWREANRLTPAGLAKTRERVVGDVKQHKELRARLADLGALRAPVMWTGGARG